MFTLILNTDPSEVAPYHLAQLMKIVCVKIVPLKPHNCV